MTTPALKRLSPASLELALEKAAHYRALNQPEEAESICLDILAVDDDHQGAWKLLGLALTDRFASGPVGLFEKAVDAFERLTEPYARAYHLGVAWERAAKAHLERGAAHSSVTAFEHALRLYEKAETLRPDLPDALLRHNRCVRLLSSHRSLRAAIEAPHDDDVRFSD
jgi:tetratricopeptide (TPR) repeat protein